MWNHDMVIYNHGYIWHHLPIRTRWFEFQSQTMSEALVDNPITLLFNTPMEPKINISFNKPGFRLAETITHMLHVWYVYLHLGDF